MHALQFAFIFTHTSRFHSYLNQHGPVPFRDADSYTVIELDPFVIF